MSDLTRNDLHFVVSRIPRDVRELMKKYPSLMIGGGFIRSTIARERVSDIDLFGPDEMTLKLAAQEIALIRKGRIHESKNAITVLSPPRLALQFITRWRFKDIEECIKSFDYTVCQAAVSCKTIVGTEGTEDETNTKTDLAWNSAVSEMFYADLAARRLNYTCPNRNEDAGGSILRMRKFIERGYTIQAGSMARVIARLVTGIEFSRVEDYRDEKAVAKILTSLLREVDPLTMVDGIEIVDEHEVETNQ